MIMTQSDIFEPYDKTITIKLLGKDVEVPENNYLLRCFQYLSMELISMGDFCWNGDCACCQVWIKTEEGEKPVLSCRTRVEEGMNIVQISDEILTAANSETDA